MFDIILNFMIFIISIYFYWLKVHSQVWDTFLQLKAFQNWWKNAFYFTLKAFFVLIYLNL